MKNRKSSPNSVADASGVPLDEVDDVLRAEQMVSSRHVAQGPSIAAPQESMVDDRFMTLMRNFYKSAESAKQVEILQNEISSLLAKSQSQELHLVEIHYESSDVRYSVFTEVDHLISKIKSLIGSKVRIFIFFGHRWFCTKGNAKFLLSNDGERWPLFDAEPTQDIDPDGFLSFDPAVRDDAPGDANGYEAIPEPDAATSDLDQSVT